MFWFLAFRVAVVHAFNLLMLAEDLEIESDEQKLELKNEFEEILRY